MTVLDAYAVISYLRDERSAGEVEGLLREPTVLTSVNAAEVRDQMVRVFGADADGLEADLALLSHSGMTILAVTPEMGMDAGRIRARHYHRERCAVSLADCIAASASLAGHGPIATADPALAAVVRAEAGRVYALPDSKGERP